MLALFDTGIFLQAVERYQELGAWEVRPHRGGASRQHQLAISEFACRGHDNLTLPIDAQHGTLGMQRDALLLGEIGAGLTDHRPCKFTDSQHDSDPACCTHPPYRR